MRYEMFDCSDAPQVRLDSVDGDLQVTAGIAMKSVPKPAAASWKFGRLAMHFIFAATMT
jgi:hypothetical protein